MYKYGEILVNKRTKKKVFVCGVKKGILFAFPETLKNNYDFGKAVACQIKDYEKEKK